MKIYLKKSVSGQLTLIFVLACFAFLPTALAVTRAGDGSFPNQNTAEDEDTLFSLTPRADNTAMGFDAPDSDTTGSDNALASWNWTVTGRLNTARWVHTATLLRNGMVLVAGGSNGGSYLVSAELYDPASGTWTVTGSLNTGRRYHTATLLRNGMVLVSGGVNLSGNLTSAELYNPASGTWAVTGSLNTARSNQTATLLHNGMVLVAGGLDSNFIATASAELHDPASGTWTTTGSLNNARYNNTATLLRNGMVLVAGGYDFGHAYARAELGHGQR